MNRRLEAILASHNLGKIREFQELFRDSPIILKPWEGHGEIVDETGSTYHQNALLKAQTVVESTGLPALADDSGIEVDALGGLPGVRSARFVSDNPWYNSREILLRLLTVAPPLRTARMRAVLCLSVPGHAPVYAEGVLEGTILMWPQGHHGFVMDPIFSVDGHRSLGDYPDAQKNAMSHRARAVTALIEELKNHASLLGDK